MNRAATVVCVVVAGMLGTAATAGADCAGPGMEVDDATVAPGEELVVRGFFFGDACYDTIEPPPGESEIGLPLQQIELHIFQGPMNWLVATGDADENYEFEVRIVIPADLEPGPAFLQARSATTSLITLGPVLDVIDTPSVETNSEHDVASFGPTTSTTTSTTTASTGTAVTTIGEDVTPEAASDPTAGSTIAPPPPTDTATTSGGGAGIGVVIVSVLAALAVAGGVGAVLRRRR